MGALDRRGPTTTLTITQLTVWRPWTVFCSVVKTALLAAHFLSRGGSRGRVQGCAQPPPLEMTRGFLIQLVFCKIWRYVRYVFSAVHIILLLSQKPSSSYLLLKFVYVTSQLRCSSAHFIVILCKRIFSLYLTYQCGVHKHLINNGYYYPISKKIIRTSVCSVRPLSHHGHSRPMMMLRY